MIKAYAAFEAKGELKPFEYDSGVLGRDEVEIDVHYCGICHSDLSMIDNDWGFSDYPLVPGHEVVGVIAAVGEDVKSFSIGQNVGLGWHSGYCNECKQCGAGDQNLCEKVQPTIAGHYGGFADKVRAQAQSVVAIPEGIDLETAGPMFCGGVTVFNPLVQYDIPPTSKVAVIGIGGLGHLALQFLNAWGCEVTAFTSSESKIEEAKKLGAHHTLNSRDKAEIKSAKGRFDVIISTVNVALNWNLYLSTLAPKGRLHFAGATLEPLDINVFALMEQQKSVSSSSVGSPQTIATMLEFAKRHDIKPQIEMFRMDQVNEAMDRLKSGDVHYRVVLSNK
ncbi:NADPH-dependent aldehyde reductase Ahr [Hirschia baltica]|uniref:alcohol dehydrogenase (NADP(+)) n=1 Tax=Hirschia baltica (strain ATCC 49814 / DSM 5838 / IFAM 1418) TaxID=582402 RepID=C6XI40_HIRBI|nr:NAD(P)-dependent alcohol dehydrogenase [Hirschia baltica]ACT58866.1 Alcohol dehydrogenase GroES domain protein [Hirschia baltica ATCC 49814]